ncbi:flagellar hook-length control protein FliK [Geothermobacter ehrlichii]|uniref:Flagellar hook-length control protein FliK n=1 Tax=Geothermobacter ehrlichii TaxID=213224 RepID=A0A5D3WPM9_9BACT|nr:flagellar hook-length control protein FliK [Geothermobacter ehrlichii]TYP00167.1 flagellar hook-length control protein FliK [Geothermobacter ehrlichii]
MSLINPLAAPAAPTANPGAVLSRESREQNLRRDQIVRASVVEGGLERVLLQVDSKTYWVETEVPLAKGQKLDLQLAENGEGLVLKLLFPSMDDHIRRVLHLVGRQLQVEHLLGLLSEKNGFSPDKVPDTARAFLAAMHRALEEPERVDGRILRTILESLGLDFERQLADGKTDEALGCLKGLLLRLQAEGSEHPREEVRLSMQLLESMQLFHARLARDGLFFLPLPLPFIDYGYLLYEEGRPKDKDGQKTDRLRILLSMSAIGTVDIKLLKDESGLDLRLEVEREEVLAAVKEFRQELQDALTPLGLRSMHLTRGRVQPERHLLHLLTGGTRGVLDTRI